ncbi:hypothetical protein WJX75_002827 [Coccomyxa subellipsoidea]|uniref:Uncharacterized protein n=1 Tax=Coccomyxa subellipsoidea TaxID=248742 RepID=A0ABR2Z2Y8_9CHLO
MSCSRAALDWPAHLACVDPGPAEPDTTWKLGFLEWLKGKGHQIDIPSNPAPRAAALLPPPRGKANTAVQTSRPRASSASRALMGLDLDSGITPPLPTAAARDDGGGVSEHDMPPSVWDSWVTK